MPKVLDRSPFARAMAEVPVNSNTISNGKRIGRRPDSMEDWAPYFIGALMEGASIRRAVKHAGVDLSLPYQRRKTDEVFARAWSEACTIGTEFLEHEAARRAYHGVLKPVFQRGECVGHVREYSDTLLIFMLKGRKPEVYRDGLEDGGLRAPTTINVQIVNVDKVGAAPALGSTGPEVTSSRSEPPPASGADLIPVEVLGG